MRRLKTKRNGSSSRRVDYSKADCGPGTIMFALERILAISEDCELDNEQLAVVNDEFEMLKERLSFTKMQSMVVAMLIDSDLLLATCKMASFLGIKNIRMLRYVGEIEELVQRRIVEIQY